MDYKAEQIETTHVMTSDSASLTSSRSLSGGSDVIDESAKVFEVAIENCEDVLGKKKNVEVAVRACWKILGSQHGQCLCGRIFKVNLLARGKGFRVWMENVSMQDLLSSILPFFQKHFEKLTGASITTKLASDEDVKILRGRDELYKAQMENLKTDYVARGMRITENLSSMLLKRKNQESSATQQKVSRLVEMTGTINNIVRSRLKVVNDDEGSEPEESQS